MQAGIYAPQRRYNIVQQQSWISSTGNWKPVLESQSPTYHSSNYPVNHASPALSSYIPETVHTDLDHNDIPPTRTHSSLIDIESGSKIASQKRKRNTRSAKRYRQRKSGRSEKPETLGGLSSYIALAPPDKKQRNKALIRFHKRRKDVIKYNKKTLADIKSIVNQNLLTLSLSDTVKQNNHLRDILNKIWRRLKTYAL